MIRSSFSVGVFLIGNLMSKGSKIFFCFFLTNIKNFLTLILVKTSSYKSGPSMPAGLVPLPPATFESSRTGSL